MPEINTQRTVTETTDEGLDRSGAAVAQHTTEESVHTSSDRALVARNIIWFVAGVIIALLATRFVLKLLGANPASGFVNFVYSLSGLFSAPFDNIFGTASANAGAVQSVFEPSIIVAALVYALIAWGLAKLVTLNRPHGRTIVSH